MAILDVNLLTPHERRRYEYLMRIAPYWSPNERAELEYLEQRMVRSDLEPAWDALQTAWDYDARPTYPKRRCRKKRKRGFFKRTLKVLLIGLLCLSAYTVYGFVKGRHQVTKTKTVGSQTYFEAQKASKGTNILILGVDARDGSADDMRTDTMMVLNVGNGKPKLVSFMRDTLVNVDGVSYDGFTDLKLNSAYGFGNGNGVDKVRETLTRNFGVPIEHYVVVDFKTFVKAIDAFFSKGVDITPDFGTVNGVIPDYATVPNDLGFENGGTLYQNIRNERQMMNGATLLNYARYRGADDNDAGRVRRQQQVLDAITEQALSLNVLANSPSAVGQVYELVDTSLSMTDILSYLRYFVSGDLERISVPESGDWIDSYDRFGGQGLMIDAEKYRSELTELGMVD